MPTKTIDPYNILNLADSFFRAQEHLYETISKEPASERFLTAPALLLSVIPSELFLKCLICIETNQAPPPIHDLEKLFKKLRKTTQERIKVFWDWYVLGRNEQWTQAEAQFGVQIPRDLITALKVGSKSFERMRYHYEGRQDWGPFILDDLPHMLGLMVLELKPEWNNLPAGWKAPFDFNTPPPKPGQSVWRRVDVYWRSKPPLR